jgi:hypothetical protein
LNEARQVAVACIVYAADHEHMLPASFNDLTPHYFHAGDSLELAASYELVTSGKIDGMDDPGKTVLLRARQPVEGIGRVVAFVDGHCEIVPVE